VLGEEVYERIISGFRYGPPQPLRVVLSGDSGGGKSKLLTQLLGQPGLRLSSAGGASCTRCPMHFEYAEGERFTAEVKFYTREVWERRLAPLLADLEYQEDEEDADPEARGIARSSALKVLNEF